MELGLAIISGLPGVAAAALAARRIVRGQTIRRHPRTAQLVALTAALLIGGACHSIDENAFAHSPVPLTKLPFHEPVTYTGGASDGQLVPFQHGLLGSYFAGAQYDRLDHQQIDSNVNFGWDGTGNPVISAPDGIDHNDGDFRLPDSWGIWSVVWEGYLVAPADGTYLLRTHVNNGGWLEMKGPSGALTTVINCAGGTGFEGDCDANVPLTAGPQYIRFSYFNNAPPSANAILSWQPPGSASVDVVPASALQTQQAPAARRSFIFVHGIRGNADGDAFALIIEPLRRQFPGAGQVSNFRYFQDVGDATSNTTVCKQPASFRAPASTGGLPLNLAAHSIDSSICDSQSNVGISAVLLDSDVRAAHAKFGGPVTIIANSMGGAIVRAFFAYAVEAQTGAAEPGVVSDVFFLQGAQEGSYIAYSKLLLLGLLTPAGPAQEIVFDGIAEKIRQETGWDATRPAIEDLTPVVSQTYRYTNPAARHVPDHIRYFNVASDIQWTTQIDITGYTFGVPLRYSVETNSGSLGDYVMLQGSDNPTSLPLLGGERFAPAVIGRGQLSHQWILHHELVTQMSATITYIPTAPFVDVNYSFPNDPLHVPESHFELGRQLDQITVTDRLTGAPMTLDQALLRELFGTRP